VDRGDGRGYAQRTLMEKERTLKRATVVYLVKGDSVLLGRKKKHIGRDRLNGPGGGLEGGESPEEAAIRELREEIGIVAEPSDLAKIAEIVFVNTMEDGAEFPCTVHFYVVRTWAGEPCETEEMGDLKWFPLNRLPLDQMMPGDRFWLFAALSKGEKIKASITYGPHQQYLIGTPEVHFVESFDDD
jgi:8-oxo-dGTP diphosphatase